MAALGHTVDSGSGASGNYASLNALEAAQGQDLTDGGGDTYTATCITTGDKAADTTSVTFDGWTTAVANYVLAEAGSGHEAVKTGIDTNRYRLDVGSGDGIEISIADMRVNALQIEGSSGGHGIEITNGDAIDKNYRISNCRIGTASGAHDCININAFGGTEIVDIWVCILEGGGDAGVDISDINTVNIYNTVIYNNGGEGVNRGSGTITVKNCPVFKNADDFAGTITVDFCASDDGDGTNDVAESGGGVEWPSDFNDSANGDFTLLTGSNLKGAGINDPGSGLFSTDMDSDTYVTDSWSLGVDEFVAAVGGATITVLASAIQAMRRRIVGTGGSGGLIFDCAKIKERIKEKLWRYQCALIHRAT